jgi:hypothetical protein
VVRGLAKDARPKTFANGRIKAGHDGGEGYSSAGIRAPTLILRGGCGGARSSFQVREKLTKYVEMTPRFV